ncbi:hypothetical protein AA313_de0200813 [Arthrobotrys entomopaga]|nr:hypothetical protein AA313_de0200813 [Arthrobotrys entomopaga]
MPGFLDQIYTLPKDQLSEILNVLCSRSSKLRESVELAILVVLYLPGSDFDPRPPKKNLAAAGVPDTAAFDIYEMPLSEPEPIPEPVPAPAPAPKPAPKPKTRLKTSRNTVGVETRSGRTRQSQRLKKTQNTEEEKPQPRSPEKRKLENEPTPLCVSGSNANIQRIKPTKKAKTESEKQVNCTLCGDLFYQASNGPKQCLKDRYHPGKMQVAPIWDKWLGDWKGDKSFDYFTYVEDFPEGFSWSCCSGIGDAAGCTSGLGFHSYLDKPCTTK